MIFSTLFAEITLSTEMLRSLLAGISQADAQVKPTPEAWSILEVVCHLYDEEREDFRQRLDYFLHKPGIPFPPIDPQGWVTARSYNQQDFKTMVEKFFTERASSLEWLAQQVDSDWEITRQAPWGTFKAGEMLAAWIAHDNLHLRQLVELRRFRIEQITALYNPQYAGEW